MDTDLLHLSEITQEYFRRKHYIQEVVTPSIPIMYFGDFEAYKKSSVRIVTVGLNPSNNEFQRNDRELPSFFRFPEWEKNNRYLETLNSYFETGKSYDDWFGKGYENVLNGMDASYYSINHKSNRALHTDIFTPIATNPTWTKLGKETQIALSKEGFEIWKSLIEILNPHIILSALSQKDLFYIDITGRSELYRIDYTRTGKKHKRPYAIWKALLNGRYIILARTVNFPFGDISHEKKLEIGKIISSHFNH